MTIKITGIALLSCIGLGACANTGPGSAATNSPAGAPSGITSSNGGGQRQLGDIPSIGTNTGSGPTITNVPNGKGNAY